LVRHDTAAAPIILPGSRYRRFLNRWLFKTHNTRRGASTATPVQNARAEAREEHPMPFFDSTIQFLGFDGWRKYESLWRRWNNEFEHGLKRRSD